MSKSVEVPEEVVMSKIYMIRGQKVMLDRDLAELYGVETKRLKEQVRRNITRFPGDFMFEMTKEELTDWRSQFATSNSEVMGLRVPPFVFTEHGVLMLSSVLNSPQSIKVNIQIMRIFTKMREMIISHQDLILRVEEMDQDLRDQGEDILVLFEYMKNLVAEKDAQKESEERKRIGYKRADEKE